MTTSVTERDFPHQRDGYKVSAKMTPYSSVVGSSLQLVNETGKPCFLIMFAGTTEGITKEESQAIADQLAWYINELGLEIPKR